MNRKKLALLLGAVAIAICNALIAHSLLSGHAAPAADALEQAHRGPRVLVAKRALPIGTILTPDAMGFVDWPKELTAPDNAVNGAYFLDTPASPGTSPAKLAGTVVRTDIAAGQPISRGAVVAPGERGFLAAALGVGLRAITIPVTERSGVGGFVFPGDRVDLMLTQNLHGGDGGGSDQSLAVTETILHNLRVLATDQSMGGDVGASHMVAHPTHTVTLEVTPRNAEKIEVSQSIGALSLALRALTDAPAQGFASANPDRANPDRAIASGTLSIPANASRQDEERLIGQAAASPDDGAGAYVTGGDVSRFLRRSMPRMMAGAMAENADGPPLSSMARTVAGAMRVPSAANGPSATVPPYRGGAVVTVSRGKEITPAFVGGQ